MNTIKKLFDEKFTPAISKQVADRNIITARREHIEYSRQGFLKKIASTQEAIKALETALDDKVIAGKPTDEVLGKLATRQGELKAFERQIQRLTDEDTDEANAEKNANLALSAALGAALDSLRPDVQALVESHLEAALAVLIAFENAGHGAEAACGVELPKERDLAVYRFLNLGDHFKRLGAWLEGCGEDMSAIRRREVRQQWAGKNKIAA